MGPRVKMEKGAKAAPRAPAGPDIVVLPPGFKILSRARHRRGAEPVPDGRGRDFEDPVRRDSPNDRGVAAPAGRIDGVAGGKRDAFDSKERETCAMSAPD